MKPPYIYPGIPPKYPPDPPKNNVYRVRIGGHLEGQQTYNVLYYSDLHAPLTAKTENLEDLIDQLEGVNGLVTYMSDASSEAMVFDSILCESPTSPTLAPVIRTVAYPGGRPGACLPTQMAVTIAKVTAWKGKQGRGRISLPGVPLNDVTNSLLTFTTNYVTVANAMKLTLAGIETNYRPGLYVPDKKYSTGELVFNGWNDLTDTHVRTVLGTARKRKLGVGI